MFKEEISRFSFLFCSLRLRLLEIAIINNKTKRIIEKLLKEYKEYSVSFETIEELLPEEIS